MNITRKIKIISHIILFSILLNASLNSIILGNLGDKPDLFAAFSSVAGAVAYSYNPIQFMGDLNNKIQNCIYKKSDRQDAKKNNSGNPVNGVKNNFAITVFSHPQIKNLKQLNNFYIDKSSIYAGRSPTYNLYENFRDNNPAVFVFYFMLLAWLAVLFRKRLYTLKNIKFVIKNI